MDAFNTWFDRVSKRNIPGSTWVECEYMQAYVRYHPTNSKRYIQIASVAVLPEFQHQGHFTAFLENAEKRAKEARRCVYVENVMVDGVKMSLVK